MADISKIRVDDIDYDVKDVVAREKLESLVSFSIDASTDEELINLLQSAYDSTKTGDVKIGRIYIRNNSTQLPGGHWLAVLSNTWDTYGFLIAIKYNSNGIPQIRYLNYWDNSWGEWVNLRPLPVVSSSDNGKILKVVDGVWTAVAE